MAVSDYMRSLMGSTAAVDVQVTASEPPPADDKADPPPPAEPEAEKAAVQPVATAPEAPKAADPAEVAEFCTANGCPALAGPLIREKATMDQVKARVGAAETIRAMVADAGKISASISAKVADEFISAGLSVEDVRTKLWDRVVKAQSPEIRGSIAADTGADTGPAAMKKAVDKVNARIDATQPKEG